MSEDAFSFSLDLRLSLSKPSEMLFFVWCQTLKMYNFETMLLSFLELNLYKASATYCNILSYINAATLETAQHQK